MPKWNAVWLDLQARFASFPECKQHPDYPTVRTLAQGSVNDILEINEIGLVVRSHRTMNDDFIEVNRLRVWWDHLVEFGTASLKPGDANNPHPWRSRVVGALITRGLPTLVRVVNQNEIALIGFKK